MAHRYVGTPFIILYLYLYLLYFTILLLLDRIKLRINTKLNLYDSVSREITCCYPDNPVGAQFTVSLPDRSRCIVCRIFYTRLICSIKCANTKGSVRLNDICTATQHRFTFMPNHLKVVRWSEGVPCWRVQSEKKKFEIWSLKFVRNAFLAFKKEACNEPRHLQSSKYCLKRTIFLLFDHYILVYITTYRYSGLYFLFILYFTRTDRNCFFARIAHICFSPNARSTVGWGLPSSAPYSFGHAYCR